MTNHSSLRWFVGIALAGLLLFSGRAFADDTPVRKVTVTGVATIKVAPDEMHWTVAISIHDVSVAQAKARHDASLTAALNFIKSLGAAAKDLQTGGMRIDQPTNFFPPNVDRSKPDTCSTQFIFTLIDFDKYGAICDALAKFDGVEVQGVDYASSKAEATKRDALKQALLNARDKANDLAMTADCTLGKPLEILEGGSGEMPRPMMMSMARMPAGIATPQAVPGQIEFTANVTATYQLN